MMSAAWRVLSVRQLARNVPLWCMSAKVPVMRAAMAAAFIESAMMQAAESVVAAAEPGRETCYGKGKEEESHPPPIPKELSLASSPHCLPHPLSWQWQGVWRRAWRGLGQ